MVFFTTPLDPKEEVAMARANFEKPLRDLNPPGSFVTAENLDQLVQLLRRAIRQKLVCQILKPDGTLVGEEPLDVTGPGDEDKWYWDGLEPGIYKLRVLADRKYEQDVELGKGDRLLVKLVDAGGAIGFEKGLYSDDFGSRAETEAAGWRLAGLASLTDRQEDRDRLQVLARSSGSRPLPPVRRRYGKPTRA